MIRVIEARVGSPQFKVSMQGEASDSKGQATGIRQGCTLSPFLFTLILAAIMEDVEAEVRRDHPMATTPIMSVMDLEYADDTVLLAGSAEVARLLIAATEKEAAKYGLKLNRDKTCRLAYNTAEEICFEDGTKIPRVKKVEYLGTVMDERGDPGEEIRVRLAKALGRCKALRPIWASGTLTKKLAAKVLRSCVFSAMIYGLHTLYFGQAWERRLDAMQIRCLRRALGIKTTYASKIAGLTAYTNQYVAEVAKEIPISLEVQRNRYKLLGHTLRRDGGDAGRAVTYDRFARPRELSGKNRWGTSRKKWATEVLKSATTELQTQGLLRGARPLGAQGSQEVARIAQDREAWKGWVTRWYTSHSWRNFGLRGAQ